MNSIKCFRALLALAFVALSACGGGGSNDTSNTPPADTGSGTIGAAGGTVATGNGNATAVFPANAFATDTSVTIAASTTAPASSRLVSGTAFDFGPSGTIAKPVQVTLKYASASVPTAALESRLVLYTAVAGAWQPVAGGSVDTVAHTVSAPVTHFGTYAVLADNQFAGAYSGTFSGGSSGTWQGTVDTSGVFDVTATGGFAGTTTLNFTGAATIPLSGSVASQGVTVTFAGTFALQPNGTTVLASGTWSSTSAQTGTWTGSKP
jgi:hypothetical protein